MMSIADAQRDMREAYYGGATGAVTSATTWFVAGLVATFADPLAGILTLIFGGMLIFPGSVVLSKILGLSGRHHKDNPLASLAGEGTVWMVLSIPVAVAAALYKVEWFFPAMLLVIGGRYLTFATLYGMRLYWVFGATLVLCAVPLAVSEAPTAVGAFAGALIEYVYGIAIFIACKPRVAH